MYSPEDPRWTCPKCGGRKYPTSIQCSSCGNKSRSQKLKGVEHDEQRKESIKAGIQQARAEGRYRRDPGSHTRGKPSPKAVPAGTERIVKDGRVQVKCADGKWRYRSWLVWEAANGPVPAGRIIHHDNENPMDDRLENLVCVTRAEHARIHNTPEVARSRQAAAVEARKRNGSY